MSSFARLITRSILVSAFLVSGLPSAPALAASITDFTFWNTPLASGGFDPTRDNYWNTRAGDNPRDIFISTQPNASFTSASVVNPATTVSLALNPGANVYYFYVSNGIVTTNYGLNLFFSSATTPSISAVAAYVGSFSPISGSTQTLGTTSFVQVPGAGTLSFLSGTETVTLTNFQILALTDGTGGTVDRVSGYGVGPDGIPDFYGTVTITVTPTSVPEPQSWALIISGGGILASMLVCRHRIRQH